MAKVAKAKTLYICSECGGQAPKWQGQCPRAARGTRWWNRWRRRRRAHRFQALAKSSPVRASRRYRSDRRAALRHRHRRIRPRAGRRPGGGRRGADRRRSGHRQIDAAAAGAGRISPRDKRALYVSGEESGAQIALRAQRGSAVDAHAICKLLAEIQLEKISGTLADAEAAKSPSSTRSRPSIPMRSLRRPARSRRCANARRS